MQQTYLIYFYANKKQPKLVTPPKAYLHSKQPYNT